METGKYRVASYQIVALTDANGNVKLNLAKDEVHPTAEGYAAMRPIAAAAISGKR